MIRYIEYRSFRNARARNTVLELCSVVHAFFHSEPLAGVEEARESWLYPHREPHEKNVPADGSSTSLSFLQKTVLQFFCCFERGCVGSRDLLDMRAEGREPMANKLTEAVKFSDLSMFLADICLSSAGEESQIYGSARIPFVLDSSVN